MSSKKMSNPQQGSLLIPGQWGSEHVNPTAVLDLQPEPGSLEDANPGPSVNIAVRALALQKTLEHLSARNQKIGLTMAGDPTSPHRKEIGDRYARATNTVVDAMPRRKNEETNLAKQNFEVAFGRAALKQAGFDDTAITQSIRSSFEELDRDYGSRGNGMVRKRNVLKRKLASSSKKILSGTEH